MSSHYEDTDYCGCGRTGYCTPRCPDPEERPEPPVRALLSDLDRFLAPPTADGLLATYRTNVVRRVLLRAGGAVGYEALPDAERVAVLRAALL